LKKEKEKAQQVPERDQISTIKCKKHPTSRKKSPPKSRGRFHSRGFTRNRHDVFPTDHEHRHVALENDPLPTVAVNFLEQQDRGRDGGQKVMLGRPPPPPFLAPGTKRQLLRFLNQTRVQPLAGLEVSSVRLLSRLTGFLRN
jgi:hypothetical protein